MSARQWRNVERRADSVCVVRNQNALTLDTRHSTIGGLHNAAGFDANGTDFDPARTSGLGIENSTYSLQICIECTWRDGGHVLADTALLLGLTAPVDDVSTDRALATNFTASRHVDLLR